MKKFNIFFNILKVLFSLFLCFSVLLFLSYHLFDSHIVVKNYKKYKRALNVIKEQDMITHFPKAIPNDAKNVKLYCHTSKYNGETLLLKFKVDESYIEQELKNHKFINTDGSQQKLYNFYSGNGIKPDGFIFYVLDNEDNRYKYKEHFPFFNGIGVDKDNNYILYYYFVWGD